MSQMIMIAANDPNILYLLQRYSEESGFYTVNVTQGKDLLALAHRTQPALIIVDSELPETTGQAVLRQLKAEPATRDIPVVVYSCLDEDAEEWREGAAGYLRKSVLYDDFLAILKRAGIHS